MGRRLGQHFLTDPVILDRIVDGLLPASHDVVVEVGPGKGSLTRRLAPRVGRVVAVEKDPVLARGLAGAGRDGQLPANVAVIEGDALELDWHLLANADAPVPGLQGLSGHSGRFKVVGNIPYYITSPLIEKALTPPLPSVAVFLLQREVADRLRAKPGSKVFGALSVGVQSVAAVERIAVVRAGSFQPPPQVDSAVVRLTPLAEPLVSELERPAFRRLVVGLFGQRRKQLVRAIREVAGLDRAAAERLLEEARLAPDVRSEVLHPADFVRLLRAMNC